MNRLSAPVYFTCVAAVTALGFGLALLLRPTFAYSVREWVGLEKPPPTAPGSFYVVRVAPLLEEHCVGCHGPRRHKGKLRVDSYAGLMRGGRNGAVVHADGGRKSELVHRITLPATDSKAMPPEGKQPLAADEVTVIKLWVAAGASGVQPVAAIKGAPKPVPKIKFAEIDEAAVKQQRAALATAVAQLQTRFPGVIAYESRGSADLQVNASLQGGAFGDRELKALEALRERIVWADFSGTGISDASIQALATMPRLRVLRLSNTKVTDAMLEALAASRELKSISVVGTPVTEKPVAALRGRGVKVHDGKA